MGSLRFVSSLFLFLFSFSSSFLLSFQMVKVFLRIRARTTSTRRPKKATKLRWRCVCPKKMIRHAAITSSMGKSSSTTDMPSRPLIHLLFVSISFLPSLFSPFSSLSIRLFLRRKSMPLSLCPSKSSLVLRIKHLHILLLDAFFDCCFFFYFLFISLRSLASRK